MRAMFGLVSLLVVMGILVLMFRMFEVPTLEKGKETHDQVQQMSGRGQDGQSAMDSFKAEPQQQGSQLSALLVTAITPGGAADTYYGLKKGDRIIQISTGAGLQKINEASNGDAEMAKAMLVQESFQASRPIVVLRNGKPLTLPASAAPAPTSPQASQSPTASAPPPAAPTAQPQQPHNVWEQVDGIKKAAGQ
jgi:hypothetical protein